MAKIVPSTIRHNLQSSVAFLVTVFVIAVIYFACRNGYDTSTSKWSADQNYSSESCDLFSGKWVFDNESYPLYSFNNSLITLKAEEYNASIEFYWSPLLVESNSDDPWNHRFPDPIVRAQAIYKHGRHWTDGDILVFNTYLWWIRPSSSMNTLWGSFESGNGIFKRVGMLRSYEMALKTWSDWLEIHIDRNKSQLFFMSMSPTHKWAEEWGKSSNGNCYNEQEMIEEEGYRGNGTDPRMMRIVEDTIDELKRRGLQVKLMNITQLSEYRKDGHPSIYRKQWLALSEEQLAKPTSYSDCTHWCLPGVPDVWNELLFAHIFS
ncbi:hypothetical protein ACET3Z_014048 [Daucus carota]